MEGFENNIPKKSDAEGVPLDERALQNKAEMTQEEIEALKEQITEAETLLEQQLQEIEGLNREIEGLTQERLEYSIATEKADLELELNENLSILEEFGGLIQTMNHACRDNSLQVIIGGAAATAGYVSTYLNSLQGAMLSLTVGAITLSSVIKEVYKTLKKKEELTARVDEIKNRLDELNNTN